MIYSTNFDVICVTETWLSDSIFDQKVIPCNYTIYRNDRKSRGGGVLAAVKQTIHSSLTDHLEGISLQLHLLIPLSLCCVYLPPNSDNTHISMLVSYLSELTTPPCGDITIVGDFNLPDIDWDTLSAASRSSELFCDFVFNNNLCQLIDKPTHTKGNTLDLIITNTSHRIQDINISSHIYPFKVTHSAPPQPQSTPQYVFDLPKADYSGLCSHLMDSDFSPLLYSKDVNFIWSSLKNIIYNGMNYFIPKVRLRRYQYPCWFTPELRHLSKCARTQRRKISNNPSTNNLLKLSELEDSIQQKILIAKSSYETNLIHSFAGRQNNKIYSYIRSMSASNSIPSCLHLGSLTATSDHTRASLFNQFFHSVFTTSSYVLPPMECLPQPAIVIDNITISQLDVLDALQSLDTSRSMRIDGIGPKLLKNCALALYVPIHHLFSLSITNHTIPSE